MHDADVRDGPRCGTTPGPITRDQWPQSLLDTATEHWLLELQDSGQHGTHSLELIDTRPESYRLPVAELSFDHDDDAATCTWDAYTSRSTGAPLAWPAAYTMCSIYYVRPRP